MQTAGTETPIQQADLKTYESPTQWTPSNSQSSLADSSSSIETSADPSDVGSQTTSSDASGSDVVDYYAPDGQPVLRDSSSNRSSSPPTFGNITSKSGECVVRNPTEYITNEELDWVWEHRIGPNADTSDEANWNVMANKNFIMDHLVANNGSMNYCVRWDSTNTLSKSVASKFQGILTRHYNEWNKWLKGYNCWPFEDIKVNMVGFATKDASLLDWTDDSIGQIYEGDLDASEGVPQCPDECYRFYDSVNNVWSDTSACKGEPFDVFLRMTQNIEYGFGFDWGQEVSLNNTLEHINDKNMVYIGHEIGHSFGLPDFYVAKDKPSKDFPRCIMMAASSIIITPSDGWMLRRVLDHVRSV
ncbi:hypothetical protein BBJ29_008596 [Phytophthora kernoviae]|uniref:Uncharacterized protein n=1 Tax=Phytophthora kernoviae TaxID=325452 RepID=A0A3F2REP7_9STRA|nr:hypothetical protein BBP00_00009215 [Phytophthora kernoviae]RLN71071.1 hypothetical protein BBJ29_008596 [Phytophthora kernoviae]